MTKRGDVRHENVETGKWTDIPQGMIVAHDTYVDPRGILRSSKDHSVVVWHFKNCNEVGIKVEEIVYDPHTNAPWCPQCWQKKRLQDYFGKKK